VLELRSPISEIRWLDVLNVSGEVIPPFAALRPTVVSSEGVISVAKPDTDSSSLVFFNGPTSIPIDGYGLATNHFPAHARGTGAGSAGTVAGSWGLSSTKSGFTPIGSGGVGYITVIRNVCATA
jgi:hypothetical protein